MHRFLARCRPGGRRGSELISHARCFAQQTPRPLLVGLEADEEGAEARCDQKPYFSLRSLNARSPPSMTVVISSRTSPTSMAPRSLIRPPEWSVASR